MARKATKNSKKASKKASKATFPDGTPTKKWTIAQLKAYAKEQEVDLSGLKKKDDILDALTGGSDDDSDEDESDDVEEDSDEDDSDDDEDSDEDSEVGCDTVNLTKHELGYYVDDEAFVYTKPSDDGELMIIAYISGGSNPQPHKLTKAKRKKLSGKKLLGECSAAEFKKILEANRIDEEEDDSGLTLAQVEAACKAAKVAKAKIAKVLAALSPKDDEEDSDSEDYQSAVEGDDSDDDDDDEDDDSDEFELPEVNEETGLYLHTIKVGKKEHTLIIDPNTSKAIGVHDSSKKMTEQRFTKTHKWVSDIKGIDVVEFKTNGMFKKHLESIRAGDDSDEDSSEAAPVKPKKGKKGGKKPAKKSGKKASAKKKGGKKK